jgi:hypothetical protein
MTIFLQILKCMQPTYLPTDLPTYLPTYSSTALCWALAAFPVSWSFKQSDTLEWDRPVARPLHTQTQNNRTQTSMPQMGFEPTIPVFEWGKTVHALDCAAIVIGIQTD